MEDAVLASRLDALRNSLNLVAANLESKVWQSEPTRPDARAELQGESTLWTGLETTLIREIRLQLNALNQVEKRLVDAKDQAGVQTAWVEYGKTLRDSQVLLRECLEIIGSLAIRTKDLDDKTLFVADELIRDCMTLSMGDSQYYLLVNSLGETVSKTRARIIRLRFPEWTIWDLPLAAHELGQVAITSILARESNDDEALRTLTRFLGNQQGALLATDPELNQKSQISSEAAAQAERWAQNRLRVLLADAFATYTMGPAYACSAIMLRLSPSTVSSPDAPSDSERAYTIMSMLGWMNEQAQVTRPYTDVMSRLEKAWQDTLDRSSPGSSVRPELKAHLDGMTRTFGEDVSLLTFNRTAMYPHRGQNDGWNKASDWATGWKEQWNSNTRLDPPLDRGGKLRDVLNATWLCRLSLWGGADQARAHRELSLAGQKLCREIIQARSPGNLVRAAGTAARAGDGR